MRSHEGRPPDAAAPRSFRVSAVLAGGHIEEVGDVGSQSERKWQRDRGDPSIVDLEGDCVVGPDLEAAASQRVGKRRLP